MRPVLRRVALFFTRSAHRELLTRRLKPEVESLCGTVIDIGGGRNSPLAQFWPKDVLRIRLDISARFAPDLLADAHSLPLASESFDGIVLSEVMEHLHSPHEALTEILRVLRPGGRLIASVPFAIGIHADPHDYYRYTQESLTVLLQGFENVDIRPHGNHLGAAWRAVNEKWHWLWIINPLMRRLSLRTDPLWPVGYTFVAVKGSAPSRHAQQVR